MKHKIVFQILEGNIFEHWKHYFDVLESSNFKDFRNDTFGNAFNVL